MRRSQDQVTSEEDLFVGIDLHKDRWHVTIRTVDLELFSASIPGTWEALQRVLARYDGYQLQAVYEAGYFGFRLHRPPGESWHSLSGYFSESGPPGNRPGQDRQATKRNETIIHPPVRSGRPDEPEP
jgi:hypothetical protein